MKAVLSTKSNCIVVSLLFFLFISFLANAASSVFVNGRIIRVIDGDTVILLSDEKQVLKIRLYGIDTPEMSVPNLWGEQAHWREAQAFTSRMIFNKNVTIRLTDEQTHKRYVGEVFINGLSVNREILRNGWGWWNSKYAPNDFDLKTLQAKARLKGIGLWQNVEATPPWEHRRGESRQPH